MTDRGLDDAHAAGADLCGHRSAGTKGNPAGFREACLAGVKTIPAYLAFLGACCLFIDKVDYRLAVPGGIAVRLMAALAIFLAPRYL